MHDKELDKLESEEFLNSLDQQSEPQEVLEPIGRSEPSWLPQDQAHYIYRAWATINKLYFERKATIDDYNKVASPKTPKSVYSITKSDVGRAIEQSANNIFYGRDKDSDAKKGIREYFDIINESLFSFFERKQESLTDPQSRTGIRIKKKELIVDELQQLRKENQTLKRKHAKETVDMAIGRLPLDLQRKFTTG